MMTYSERGLNLTKEFEGCRLEAYQDQGGVWTIGWGHTQAVMEGDVCTQEQADEWLEIELGGAASDVMRLVSESIEPCQVWALADFVFNVGPASLSSSTLLKKLNAGDIEGAANEFPKWNKVHINGKLTPSPGLTRRRMAEKAMFLGKDWQ